MPENQNKNLKIKKNLLVKVGRKLQKMKLEKKVRLMWLIKDYRDSLIRYRESKVPLGIHKG